MSCERTHLSSASRANFHVPNEHKQYALWEDPSSVDLPNKARFPPARYGFESWVRQEHIERLTEHRPVAPIHHVKCVKPEKQIAYKSIAISCCLGVPTADTSQSLQSKRKRAHNTCPSVWKSFFAEFLPLATNAAAATGQTHLRQLSS